MGLVLRLPQGEAADATEVVGELELAADGGGGRQATIRSWSAKGCGGEVEVGRRQPAEVDREGNERDGEGGGGTAPGHAPVMAAAAFELRRSRQLQPFLTVVSVAAAAVVSMRRAGLAGC